MHRLPLKRSGFLLLEVMLGIAVFGLFLGALGITIVWGQQSTSTGGDRVRGVAFAERALEGARVIRDGSFAALTAGAHGVVIGPTGAWQFQGTNAVTSGYKTSVTVSSVSATQMRLTAQTTWKMGINRSGSVILQTDLVDWRGTRGPGDWSTVSVDGSSAPGGTPLFNDAAVSGNYAFVTSDTSGGGAGLYVFDISNTAAPARVASSFSLGAAGSELAVKGRTLYVLTNDAAAEIRAYDISSPATLSASNLKTSFNLSGSSLAVSLALGGSRLYVGTSLSASYDEFYAFDVSNSGAIVYRGSLDHTGAVNGIALSGTSAYLATADITADMKTVNATGTSSLLFASNGTYNVSGTEQALSVAASLTGAIIGRQKGASQEMTFFNTRYGGGSPPATALNHEGSGSLVGLALDPAACYAFLAADSGRKAFQVANLRNSGLPELTTYTSTTGVARGLFYDIVRDRVYLLTRTAFLILKPGSSTGTCS